LYRKSSMTQVSTVINAEWLSRPAPEVAPDLVGCRLVRQLPNGAIIRSVIVETEAYAPGDPACHAYKRQTPRNAVMFGPAGITYVYLIYGMYHCLNVVTDLEAVPSAVLIRALQFETWPQALAIQSQQSLDQIAAGPGKLCRVLEIDRTFSGKALQPGEPLWLEHRSSVFMDAIATQSEQLVQTTRIGLTQGAEIPWRWYLKGCRAVSKF
jgi:DNA-3-methyladenine glycosylase